jgi:hypothetical protein
VSLQDYLPSPDPQSVPRVIYGAFGANHLDGTVPHRKNDISVSFGFQPPQSATVK